MPVVTGPMGSLVPKLLQLLRDEFKLQKGVKKQVMSLTEELKSLDVALSKVAQVPYDQLDPQVKLWASQVRQASYDMDDVIDTFLVRVNGGHKHADADKGKVDRLLEKMGNMFNLSKLKFRHDIVSDIEDIKKQVDEMAKRRDRYKFDDLVPGRHRVANFATATSIDPRVFTFHTKTSELLGIEEPRDALIKMLTLGDDDASDKKLKIISIVGSGGLGKTTLAKVVYEKLTQDNIYCKAFIPVGRNPDLKKVFRDILLELNTEYYTNQINFIMTLDERQLIGVIQDLLKDKRYFIVIDDIWDVTSWNAIRIALNEKFLGSKIMITTRSKVVAHAKQVQSSYKIEPLPPEISKKLFYGRIFGPNSDCPRHLSELSENILKKCGGVPLAIITIASLLANNSKDSTGWQEVCDAIGSGLSSSQDMCNMRKILLLSYYDLPSHMKPCFLYLSMYPEDYEIERDILIWKWISEGFIQPQKKGDDLFELGKSYFNYLINISLVQPAGDIDYIDEIYACRVHDMILDLIRSLSTEENFVTTSDDIEQMMSSESKKFRRLSLYKNAWPKTDVSQVRSIAIFRPSIDSMTSFSCFDMLRVLDLDGCSLEDCGGSKMCIGNLIHLRYVGLRRTGLRVLPDGIEKLQFLQVLNLDRYSLRNLRPPIFGLRRLMRLEGVRCYPKPGNLLRNLASLQELDYLYVDEKNTDAVEELKHLTQLTEIKIEISLPMNQSLCDALVNSLGNLPRLQRLLISHDRSLGNNLIKWESWTPPPQLRRICIANDFSLQTLPKWISPVLLPHLTSLELVQVYSVRPKDIQILGTLPNLLWLYLQADYGNFIEHPLQKFVVSADAFPRATHCFFSNVVTVPSMFARGAMSRGKNIQLCLRAKDFFSSGGFDFHDLAMEHLPSLRKVIVSVHGETDITEEEEMELIETLNHAADGHTNHPSINIL